LKELILGIDFHNIFYSSYYSEKLINSKGFNVNAIKGFFFRIKTLKDMMDPAYLIFASDLSREKTFRRKLYKAYKANRKEFDPNILEQLKYALRITSLLGYPILNNEIYEADDILGMISKFAVDNNMDMIISSSDKDLYQLINDNVCIFSPKSKEIIDIDYMEQQYRLHPSQWIELKMLQGDRSDNIPGIDGIGEAHALKLMNQYKSIDKIYENINQLKPAIRENLANGYDRLPLMRNLVTIETDYNKIDLNLNSLKATRSYPEEIFAILDELELDSLYRIMEYSLLYQKNRMEEIH
jgi:DNA polymerase-1